MSRHARDLVAEKGDATPLGWVHRSLRFSEKLATPDTSIADLIGEVDPIKIAEGRYLSDELTLHYGLVPRSNRGIFAVNELPDLAERIQVGLLNVLEERDVQIRGFTVRLPFDVVLVATANPEDYTNRGRIITPLKDRFGAQIRTHYPEDTDTELAIVHQEARPPDAAGGPRVEVPDFMAEIVAELSQLARQSPHVNQRSGVSVRLSISNYETLVGQRRAPVAAPGRARRRPPRQRPRCPRRLHPGEDRDRGARGGPRGAHPAGPALGLGPHGLPPSCPTEQLGPIVNAFDEARVVHAGDDLPASAYAEILAAGAHARGPVLALAGGETPRRGGLGHRVHPGGPPSHQAPQQRGGGGQGHLPGPGMTALLRTGRRTGVMTAGGTTGAGTAPRPASRTRSTPCSPSSPTTSSTTATPTRRCAAC